MAIDLDLLKTSQENPLYNNEDNIDNNSSDNVIFLYLI